MTALTLAEAPLATTLTLSVVPQGQARHLSRLGLRPGAALQVIRRSTGGGRIVSVAGARVALGRGLLAGMQVEVGR